MDPSLDFELDLDAIPSVKSQVGIVDADSIIYNLGWYYDKAGLLPPNDITSVEVVPEFVVTAVATFLSRLKTQLNVENLHLHLTASHKTKDLFEEYMGRPMKPQFRSLLPNDYKTNRQELLPPTGFYHTLRALLNLPNTYIHDQWEADEAVILHKKLNPTWVLSSNDKDVYKQHAGKNWLYDKRRRWVDIDVNFANYFSYLQAITGDPTDGFGGVPGIGEKRAMQFVSPNNTPEQNWEGVLKAFKSKGLGEDQALINMQFANMHQLHLDENNKPYINLWKPDELHLSPDWY